MTCTGIDYQKGAAAVQSGWAETRWVTRTGIAYQKGVTVVQPTAGDSPPDCRI